MAKITTMKDIEEKPMLKKLTPEEIKQARVKLEEKELEVRDLEITVELLERDIKEEIALKRQRIRVRSTNNKISELQFDIKTIKRMILESGR